MTTKRHTALLGLFGLLLLAGCGDRPGSTVTGLNEAPAGVSEVNLGPLADDDGLTERDLSGVAGTDFVTAGTGTRSNAAETVTVDVPAGATVTEVQLYWSRRVVDPLDAPASEVMVDGSPVSGAVIGGPLETSDDRNSPVTYRAELTGMGLVGDGTSSFTVEDDAPGAMGASVLVFYDDGGERSALRLWDGVDFAWNVDTEPTWRQEARPVTFTVPASDQERTAELVLFVGDVDGSSRANELDLTIGGTTETIIQPFFAADGLEWDNYVREITVPAGVTDVTVEPISPAGASNPASLVWAAAGLSVESIETGEGDGCTPGFWRQPQHFDAWVGHAPEDDLGSVFTLPADLELERPEHRTDPSDLTLLDGLVLRGGGVNALIRHAVAGLLNAASPEVSYDLTEAQVISAFDDAVAGGDIEATKDELEVLNEQGCPVNGGGDDGGQEAGGPSSHAGPPGSS